MSAQLTKMGPSSIDQVDNNVSYITTPTQHRINTEVARVQVQCDVGPILSDLQRESILRMWSVGVNFRFFSGRVMFFSWVKSHLRSLKGALIENGAIFRDASN